MWERALQIKQSSGQCVPEPLLIVVILMLNGDFESLFVVERRGRRSGRLYRFSD